MSAMAISFQPTNIPAFYDRMNVTGENIPLKEGAFFKINDFSYINAQQGKTVAHAVPLTINAFSCVCFVLSLLLLSQFLLTFWHLAYLPGFTGLVGFVSFGSLFMVVRRATSEIKRKGYID